MSYPDWVILHVPHDATAIPADVRNQFVLDDEALAVEVVRMTDHLTLSIFAGAAESANIVRAPVNRLVVDVERFPDDDQEPMSKQGMGVIYTSTSHKAQLRRDLTAAERKALLDRYYYPHHQHLENLVTEKLTHFGRCLIVDCHSFPMVALPYEERDLSKLRPDICIGTDPFHTTVALAEAFEQSFRDAGWSVAVNDPFSGTLVPQSRYNQDNRVQSVMVELNRALYLHPDTDLPLSEFETFGSLIRECMAEAIAMAS
ncbi:N-formylglutamate amidohydrolase [Asticcacaulis sp. AC402]|uniref:N-formylglutamate amidohydrolase n=1 Tax=Asticcacaulis sp. AC402 TaxID=1282361 RepID=UPI00068E7BB1|nr:N-formylglutamate amidohydrolase [Asticcacaulis sp. AC402]